MKITSDNLLWEIFKHAFAGGAGLAVAGVGAWCAIRAIKTGAKSITFQAARDDLNSIKNKAKERIAASGVISFDATTKE